MQSFHKRRIALPAAGGSDPIHHCVRPAYDLVLPFDHPPPSHALDHLGIEQLGQWHPARRWCWSSGLTLGRLHPVPAVRHDGREVMRVAIAQKERHTPRRHRLRDLMQHRLGPRHGAVTPCTLSSSFDSGSIAVQPREENVTTGQWPRLH
jgi:hypothetical protein